MNLQIRNTGRGLAGAACAGVLAAFAGAGTALAVDLASDRVKGGIYTGLVRPYYEGTRLYLEPFEVKVTGKVPGCAKDPRLRLDDEQRGGRAFENKFQILLTSWLDRKPVQLVGKATCSPQGSEYIDTVIPQ